MLIKPAIEQFLVACRCEKGLSMRTLKAYAIDLSQYAGHVDGSEHGDVFFGPEALRQYVRLLRERCKPRSVRRKLATLKAFFRFLEYHSLIKRSPFHQMQLKLPQATVLPRTIPTGHLARLIEHLYGAKRDATARNRSYFRVLTRDIAILETLFSTGMRVGEVSSLRRDQVDLDGNWIRVVGKGAKERLVPICSDPTRRALTDYVALFTDHLQPTSQFFQNRLRHRLSEQSIRNIVHKYARRADLRMHVTPHMFRHTIATMLLQQGVDIRQIQHLLGHSSILTTQIYTHILPDAQRITLESKHPRRLLPVMNA